MNLCKSFFQEQFSNAILNKNIQINLLSQEYVVSILCDNIKSETLCSLTKDGTNFPLMFSLYEKSIKSSPINQFNEYRNMGDVSLLMTGLFSDYISRKASLNNKDYYIEMGKSGYYMASRLVPIQDFSLVFEELYSKFGKIVDILNSVSKNLNLGKNFKHFNS